MAREDFLGDGLAQLAAQGTIRPIKRDLLTPAPWQPRRHFDRSALLALAHSIRKEGVRQNLVVRPHPERRGSYEIVAGERRWRASNPQLDEQLDLSPEERLLVQDPPPSALPCLILELDDRQARRLSAVENLQRENLDPVDEATYRLQLLQDALDLKVKRNFSISNLAQDIGRRLHAFRNRPEAHQKEIQAVSELFYQLGTLSWESYATNHLPLLQLPDDLLQAVREGKMAGRSALLIQRQNDLKLRQELLNRAMAGTSFKELTAYLDAQQGNEWRTLATQVRGRLGVRNLERLDASRRAKVMKLLDQLDQLLKSH